MNHFQLYEIQIHNYWDPIENKNFWEASMEIQDTYSLYKLHLFIQKKIQFDNNHSFEFYAGRNERSRKVEFVEELAHPNGDGKYKEIELKHSFPLTGLKLYYLFNFEDNWIFEIRKSKKEPKPCAGIDYPRIIYDNGVKLKQYHNEYPKFEN